MCATTVVVGVLDDDDGSTIMDGDWWDAKYAYARWSQRGPRVSRTPTDTLHVLHRMARTFPVAWQWSTHPTVARRPLDRRVVTALSQSAHRYPWRVNMAMYFCSVKL